MATTYEQAQETAEAAAGGRPVDRLLERLADRLGAKASVQAVYGEPIRHGELTVVPVARVRWGFGGGAGMSGVDAEEPTEGSGGGGGVSAEPIGHLEVGPMGATFKPIPLRPSPMLILAGGITAALLIRAVARLLGR
jgi:hypothetical protein